MNWQTLLPFKECQGLRGDTEFFWCKPAHEISGLKHAVHKKLCFYCRRDYYAQAAAINHMVYLCAAGGLPIEDLVQKLKGKYDKQLLRLSVMRLAGIENEDIKDKNKIVTIATALELD